MLERYIEAGTLGVMKHLLVGTVLIALGVWGIVTWWASFGLVMRALVPFTLLVFGLVAVLSSYYRLSTAEDFDEDFLEEEEG